MSSASQIVPRSSNRVKLSDCGVYGDQDFDARHSGIFSTVVRVISYSSRNQLTRRRSCLRKAILPRHSVRNLRCLQNNAAGWSPYHPLALAPAFRLFADSFFPIVRAASLVCISLLLVSLRVTCVTLHVTI